ncbi:EamA family transporter [Streptosporangium subroseum]|uniref:EamA family transporter n=1 Tax=Streptosporangium subroseum TaxID=106412 RepID=UPI00352EF04D
MIASTLVAFGIWNQLLSRYPAHSVAPYSLLVPVIGLITAWLVLGVRAWRVRRGASRRGGWRTRL